MRRAAGLSIVFVTACQASAPAKPVPAPVGIGVGDAPGPTAFVPHDEPLLVPCREPEGAESVRRLTDLGPNIDGMKATDPVGPWVAEIEKLLATPCYALARIDAEEKLAFDSGESLRQWWRAGGESWLRHYLPLPASDANVPAHRTAAFAPTIRTTLTLENGPAILKPLLCPLKALDDHSCGIETAGWRIRAERAPQPMRSLDDRDRMCAERARKDTSGALKYAVFHACLAEGARSYVMPLGAFQAPKDGWLITSTAVFIAQQGCHDELSMYDLATGSAYHYGCQGRRPPAKLRIGRVPTGALREAAWMMMLHHTGQTVRPQEESYPVPMDIPIARRPDERVPIRLLTVDTDDDPVVSWAWIRGTPGSWRGSMSGQFGILDTALTSYATSLFGIADIAFQEGCAPLSSPRGIPWNNLGPRIDTPSPGAAPLFEGNVDSKTGIVSAPAAKPGCPLLP